MVRRSATSRYSDEFFQKSRNRKSTVIQMIEQNNKNRLNTEERAVLFFNCRSYRMWFEEEYHCKGSVKRTSDKGRIFSV